MAPLAHIINPQGYAQGLRHVSLEWMQAWWYAQQAYLHGSKGYSLAAGKKVISYCATKSFIFFWHSSKGQCVGCPRRRRKASGRVVTCPEGWIALKRKPRNRALFALWCMWLICKIEACLRRVSVGKKCIDKCDAPWQFEWRALTCAKWLWLFIFIDFGKNFLCVARHVGFLCLWHHCISPMFSMLFFLSDLARAVQ